MPSLLRIDTHTHVIPPSYRELLDKRDLTVGSWPTPDWDAETAISKMDQRFIATGMLSLSAPDAHLGDDAAGRILAWQVYEYTTDVVERRPDRFGHFACLPPDINEALAKAAEALDTLPADGGALLSNFAGQPLRREHVRAAVGHARRSISGRFHPPDRAPLTMLGSLPSPLFDYPFDTTRTALHIVARHAPNQDAALFVSSREMAVRVRTIQAVMTSLAHRARVKRVAISVHTLRHTFTLGYLRDNPGKLVKFASLFGDESLDATAIYTQPSRDDLERSYLNGDG